MRKKSAQMPMHTCSVLRPTLRLHLQLDCLKKLIKRCRLRRMDFESRILRWEGVFFLPSGVPGFGTPPRRAVKWIIHHNAPFLTRGISEEYQQTAFWNHASVPVCVGFYGSDQSVDRSIELRHTISDG